MAAPAGCPGVLVEHVDADEDVGVAEDELSRARFRGGLTAPSGLVSMGVLPFRIDRMCCLIFICQPRQIPTSFKTCTLFASWSSSARTPTVSMPFSSKLWASSSEYSPRRSRNDWHVSFSHDEPGARHGALLLVGVWSADFSIVLGGMAETRTR